MVSIMNVRNAILCAFAALVIAGCAGGGSSSRARAPRGPAQEFSFDPLPAQALAPGQCSIYLWAAGDQQPRFIAVAYDNPAQMIARPNGRDRVLQRTDFSGDRVSGIFEQQTFSDGDLTLSLDVTFDESRPMRDGAAVQRGLLRVRDSNDWETVVPVAGMAACAPA